MFHYIFKQLFKWALDKALRNKVNVFFCTIKMLLSTKHVGFFFFHNQQFSKLLGTSSVSFSSIQP